MTTKAAFSFKPFWFGSAENLYDPKKQNLFLLQIGGRRASCGTGFAMIDERTGQCFQTDAYDEDTHGQVWYAKSVSKPKISFGPGSSPINDKVAWGTPFKLKDKNDVTMNPINITLIDPTYPNATRKLLRILRRSGYGDIFQTNPEPVYNFNKHIDILGSVYIYQLINLPYRQGGPSRNELYVAETWELLGAHITEMDFGTLDYSSDQLLEIKMTIDYISFRATTWEIEDGKEIMFEYNVKLNNKINTNREVL